MKKETYPILILLIILFVGITYTINQTSTQDFPQVFQYKASSKIGSPKEAPSCPNDIYVPVLIDEQGNEVPPEDYLELVESCGGSYESLCESAGECTNSCPNSPLNSPSIRLQPPDEDPVVWLCEDYIYDKLGHVKLRINSFACGLDPMVGTGHPGTNPDEIEITNLDVEHCIDIEESAGASCSTPGYPTVGSFGGWFINQGVVNELRLNECDYTNCIPVSIPEGIDQCQFAQQLIDMTLNLANNYHYLYNIILANCGGLLNFLTQCLNGELPYDPNYGIGCNWNPNIRETDEDGNPIGPILTAEELCDELRESIGLPPILETIPCNGNCCACGLEDKPLPGNPDVTEEVSCDYCQDAPSAWQKAGSKASIELKRWEEKKVCNTDTGVSYLKCSDEPISQIKVDNLHQAGCGTWSTASGYSTQASVSKNCNGKDWSYSVTGWDIPEDNFIIEGGWEDPDGEPLDFVNCQTPVSEVIVPPNVESCKQYKVFKACGNEAKIIVDIEAQSKSTEKKFCPAIQAT